MTVCTRHNHFVNKKVCIFCLHLMTNIIIGQASVGVEIKNQLGGNPDHIILPVGGGLSAGVTKLF